ncbi:MAG: hypothetical protein GC190_20285 [Alphaproteobacteria bacterium]|nr:hypothetical protein [Alphaproteobacteria bacterium]
MSAREFYVGYLTMPPRLKLIVRGLFAVLLGLIASDAWLIASLQPAAGDGSWADTPREYSGTLSRTPYPMLRVNTPNGLKTYLLVSDEKRGAEAALGVTPDGPVKLSGFPIARSSIGMIELAADNVAVISETPAIEEPAREVHGTATLDGEIVDSKCWLGVMRPGEGHLHKACASLCIRGGIPPMFVTRGVGDNPSVMLLTQADGSAVQPDTILPFVGDAVRLTGTIEKRGDLWVLKADLPSLTRVRN